MCPFINEIIYYLPPKKTLIRLKNLFIFVLLPYETEDRSIKHCMVIY